MIHNILLALGALNTAPRMFTFAPEPTLYRMGKGGPRSEGMNRQSWTQIEQLFTDTTQYLHIAALTESVKNHASGGKNFVLNHCVRLGWLVPIHQKPVVLHVCGAGNRVNAESHFSAETFCAVAYEGAMYLIRQGDYLDYPTQSGAAIRETISWREKSAYNSIPSADMIEKIGHKICDLTWAVEATQNLLKHVPGGFPKTPN